MKIGVLVSGGGSNLQSIIDSIKNGIITNTEISVVGSDKPQCFGLTRAEAENIPTFTVDFKEIRDKAKFNAKLIEELAKYEIDLLVLAGYMKIVPVELLNAYPDRIINIHPALLPSFPGLHGQEQAFNYGVKVAGCTVHFVDAGMDSGPIIAQRTVPVLNDDTADILSARILVEEHKVLPYVIDLYGKGKIKLIDKKVYLEED